MECHVPFLMQPTSFLQTVIMLVLLLGMYGIHCIIIKIKDHYKKRKTEDE